MAEPTAPEGAARLGMLGQIRLLSTTFWLSNVIEMFERLAWYTVMGVLPVYLLTAVEKGGPQLDNIQKGNLYAIMAMMQGFFPVLVGGFADRFGYRKMVGVSMGFVVSGYLAFGFGRDAIGLLTGGESLDVPAHAWLITWYYLALLLLLIGTGLFKPGIQGLIATQIDHRTASMAWGIFYQVVNLGGFFGPIVAASVRFGDWRMVFVLAAAAAAMIWLVLVPVVEPPRTTPVSQRSLLVELPLVAARGIGGILEPRLFSFLLVFSGFWAMYYQLYDVLPNFIDDWVDTRVIYQRVAVPVSALFGTTPPDGWEGRIPQEMMLNLNAGMVMLLAFAVGYVTGFFRSMTNMIAGIVVSALGIILLDTTVAVWVLAGIAVFSIGEMMASPTKMRYVAEIAPEGKKALFLGYVNATVGIGRSIGASIAGPLYENTGDLVVLARRHLIEATGMPSDAAQALAKSEVLPELQRRLQLDEWGARELLWNTYDPGQFWWTFTGIGMASMLGLLVFDQITRRSFDREEELLIGLAILTCGACYGWQRGLAFAAVFVGRYLLQRAWPAMMPAHRPMLDREPWIPGAVVGAIGLGFWLFGPRLS